MSRTIVAAVAVIAPLFVACGGGSAPRDPEPEAAAPTDSAPEQPQRREPAGGPGAPLLSSSGQPVSSGSAPLNELHFDLPDGWRSEPPANTMRIAQAKVPGAGGDGELAVFFFGPGGGGGTQANLDRWIGQMDVAPGAAPEQESFAANGLTVTWIDVAGTLKASSMMGTGPATDQPGYRLYGAVVEGPGGPWFFKLTGPEATLGEQRDGFLAMLASVRAQ